MDKDKTVHVVAMATAKEVSKFKSEGGPLAFSPDGKTAATFCPDGTVLLWDVTPAEK
jgi:hypothetical protein